MLASGSSVGASAALSPCGLVVSGSAAGSGSSLSWAGLGCASAAAVSAVSSAVVCVWLWGPHSSVAEAVGASVSQALGSEEA